MDRKLWTQLLTKTACPAWPCPVCHKGTVALVPKSLIHKETIESKRAHSHEAWEPEWISYTFTAWGQCGHGSCKQEFAIAGTGGIEPEFGPEEIDWADYFSPKICRPMPDIFDFPAKCPVEVTQELRAAFELLWSHHAACAGRIRVALECLMNHLGVSRRKKDKNGKFYDLQLHQRIEDFAKSQPVIGAQLMALKWLGNSGSHDADVSKDDLLDAFEIMEHALGEIIDQRSARVAALAKKLTKKHSS
jgi:hypothetical protein